MELNDGTEIAGAETVLREVSIQDHGIQQGELHDQVY
jgi:hypothetical protein